MDIVFIGGHQWDGPWFRKQQFASRLSGRGHRVFYVEDSVSIIRWNQKSKIHPYRIRLKKINNYLYIITPPAFFPFPLNPYIRSLYNHNFFHQLNKLLKSVNATDYVLWFNRMEYSTYLKNINGFKIFDLCDDLPGYSLLSNNRKAYSRQMYYLKNSLTQSNVSVASAVKIKEKYGNLAKSDIIVIPNGHNLLHNKNESMQLSALNNGIPKPIIGFIGTLFKFIDDELLEYIISSRPCYNFVFVGKIEGSFPIEKINKFKNVYFPGRIPQDQVASYIRGFNVCINPFKVHEVNDSVNPVKVFEYLANKRYVLSTRMYSLMKEEIADYICFAENKIDFLNKLDIIVQKTSINDVPDELLSSYHWDNLFTKLISNVNNKFNIKL